MQYLVWSKITSKLFFLVELLDSEVLTLTLSLGLKLNQCPDLAITYSEKTQMSKCKQVGTTTQTTDGIDLISCSQMFFNINYGIHQT